MRGCCGNGVSFPRWSRWVAVAAFAAGLAIAPQGQHISGRNQSPSQMGQQGGPFDDDDFVARRQLRALNAERQKMMISDTQKLLKLAQELNAEIESSKGTDGAALTPEQARKLANIEKLARQVKQKMSESVVSGPWVRELIAPARY
jgi:hypothetical protein